MTLQAAKSKHAVTLATVDSTSIEVVKQISLQRIYLTCFLEELFQQVFVYISIIIGTAWSGISVCDGIKQ